jgi:hypothetical protein
MQILVSPGSAVRIPLDSERYAITKIRKFSNSRNELFEVTIPVSTV